MDPITTAALATVVTGLANGATGEAGKQAWGSLVTAVRRLCGHDSAPGKAVQELAGPPEDRAHAEELAAVLTRAAERNPEFSAQLNAWIRDARRVTGGDHNVSNTISGDARIEGAAVQTGDVSGSINFGSPNT